jgi:hypothetical protein
MRSMTAWAKSLTSSWGMCCLLEFAGVAGV